MNTVAFKFFALPAFAAAALMFASAQARADAMRFTLTNNTDAMIIQFFATPVDGGGKRIELLQKKGLWAKKARMLTIADGSDACVYTIRAVFESESYYDISDKIDFCETDSYTIGD